MFTPLPNPIPARILSCRKMYPATDDQTRSLCLSKEYKYICYCTSALDCLLTFACLHIWIIIIATKICQVFNQDKSLASILYLPTRLTLNAEWVLSHIKISEKMNDTDILSINIFLIKSVNYIPCMLY